MDSTIKSVYPPSFVMTNSTNRKQKDGDEHINSGLY
jgi:hypothetical protein